ncbi:MAG: protein kinase domain-containing protein [Isosphaeraceae bacterium]
MSDTEARADALLATVAEDYLERLRAGARPAISEYTRRYPEFAERIEELLPALGLVEVFKPGSRDATGSLAAGTVSGSEVALDRLGDFRILREVGRGGMGVVYEAEQESLGRRVALKVLLPNRLLDGKLIARFEREARAAARLHHTNIVPVFGVGESDGVRYYVMQFIRGMGLDRVLDEIRHVEGRSPSPATGHGRASRHDEPGVAEIARSLESGQFGPPIEPEPEPDLGRRDETAEAKPAAASTLALAGKPDRTMVRDSAGAYFQSVARIGLQVAEALAYAHEQGTLHRDIKPSNLLLDAHGTVWVTDFGLAKAAADCDLTHTGDVVGTIRYMAPERFAGRCDARSDVYALGLTLYELLAKRPAFAAGDRNALLREVTQSQPVRLSRLDRAIPHDLETIVFKTIEKDPGQRYASAAALAEDLRRFLSDRPIAARRARLAELLLRWGRRNPVVAGLTTLVFLLLATVAAVASIMAVQINKRAGAEFLARRGAVWANAKLQETQKTLERTLYATRLYAAQSAWEAGNVRLCRDMLDAARPQQPGAADLRGFEWHYWRRRFRPAIRALVGDERAVSSVAVSPDGSRVAAGGFDGTVRIWNANTGEPLLRLAGREIVHSVAFKDDGTQLAAAGGDRTVRIWSTADGRLQRTLFGHSGRVWSVAYAPDGSRLASAGADGTVRLWDSASGASLFVERGQLLVNHNVTFSPDGRRIAAATEERAITIWDVASGKAWLTFRFDKAVAARRLAPPLIWCIRFSADGNSLFANCSGPDGLLEWYVGNEPQPPTDRVRFIETFNSYRSSLRVVAFDLGRSGTISRLDSDGMIRIDSKGDGALAITLDLAAAGTRSLALSADGSRLVTAGPGPRVTVWDTRPNPSVRTFEEAESAGITAFPPSSAASIALSPDGRRVACAGGAMPITVRDVEDGRVLLSFGGGSVSIQTIAYSPDGRYIASGGSDKLVHIWDAAHGRERLTLKGHGASVGRVAFSPDGTMLASSGLGGLVRNWDVASGTLRFRIEHDASASVVAFSPDGAMIASDGFRRLLLTDARGGWTLRRQDNALPDEVIITALAFSPNGSDLSGACNDGAIRIWAVADLRKDAANLRPRLVLRGHAGKVSGVAYSPDGRRIASAGEDATVRLWDPIGGQELLTLKGHDRPVTDVVFSPDGQRIISVGDDRTIKVWVAEAFGAVDPLVRPWPR